MMRAGREAVETDEFCLKRARRSAAVGGARLGGLRELLVDVAVDGVVGVLRVMALGRVVMEVDAVERRLIIFGEDASELIEGCATGAGGRELVGETRVWAARTCDGRNGDGGVRTVGEVTSELPALLGEATI